MDQAAGGEPIVLKDFLEEAELLQYYDSFRDILKVTKITQLKYVANDDLTQIGMSKPEQRCYKKLYNKYFSTNYFLKIKRLLGSSKKQEPNPLHVYESVQNVPNEVLPFNENNVKVPTKHIIPVEDITINKELGMGQFGVVQQGTWSTGNQRVQVAIKCLGNERMTSNCSEFLKEAAVMHSIEHSNIVRLYGVVLHMDSLMLVTELAPLRSLLECLQEISLRPNFPVLTLCYFAEQICDGMTYLENKRLIHRDLAARNILVFSKDRVKISDFGLSRALGVGKDYYQTNYNVNLKLPVAWCAPECILYLRFTSASDTWAFGVCLWEMFTYGFQPWAAFSGQQILETIDAPNSQRLEKPDCCSDAYYATMLECWSHDPTKRPKFKDLALKLREIRPQQLQATTDSVRLDGRRNNCLVYKDGEIITVLGKEERTNSPMWYGVLALGVCGMFDPTNMVPFAKPERAASLLFHPSASLSPNPTRSTGSLSGTMRSSLVRSDAKRHTYTGKKCIQRSMISGPQGDVKHTGHIGLDGAYFGDVSFLDPAGCPPRQVVTPYKPLEDSEHVPLINPNSPSHLTAGVSSTPLYQLVQQENIDQYGEPGVLPNRNSAGNLTNSRLSLRAPNLKLIAEPSCSKTLLDKVKSTTLARSFKPDYHYASTSKRDDVHEYHEISDTDTDSTLAENVRTGQDSVPDSPSTPKSNTDFTQSLLDEIDLMFRNLDARGRRDALKALQYKLHHDIDDDTDSMQLSSKAEKKKCFSTSTMKPMSAHDEKTLDTAVALANKITTRSMNDLGIANLKALGSSPVERSKFHFKFPLVSSHVTQPSNNVGTQKESQVKTERRNFSDEANSVPDIQETITEQCKLAYASLIEQPTLSSSLIGQINKDAVILKPPRNYPKPQLKPNNGNTVWNLSASSTRRSSTSEDNQDKVQAEKNSEMTAESNIEENTNEIPLPQRSTKPKLVDRPRHVRKYPLVMPDETEIKQYQSNVAKQAIDGICKPIVPVKKPNIYQNFFNYQEMQKFYEIEEEAGCVNSALYQNINIFGTDVIDGPSIKTVDRSHHDDDNEETLPFEDTASTSQDTIPDCEANVSESNNEDASQRNSVCEKRTLCKGCIDHVSVEDLLEFADLKPCGRQRGVESDEVRIMCKVLKQQATPSVCLDALEVSDWNVHHAIKMMRVKSAIGGDITLEECSDELKICKGDVLKASEILELKLQQREIEYIV